MSVDWTVVCDRCKEYCHLGQDMGGVCSFGYGSQDESGQIWAGKFISNHIDHHLTSKRSFFGMVQEYCTNFSTSNHLRIVRTDNIPDDYSENKEKF